jgi:hypothetical protein
MKSNPDYKSSPPAILELHDDRDFGLMVTETRSAYCNKSIAENSHQRLLRIVKLKKLLEQCDFWLAHLEDYTKGNDGDEITQLRSEIETELTH